MENNKEYIFYLNWEDNMKNPRKVGFLAKIENEFYFVISNEKNAEAAYNNGFIGIPAFRSGQIYKSTELFDFFKNRIQNKKSEDPCAELAKSGGKSMIDSFFVEEVPELLADRQKQALLEAYQKQEELKALKNEEKNKGREEV